MFEPKPSSLIIRRFRSALQRLRRRVQSLTRVAVTRLANSNVVVPWTTTIESGVTIKVTDGGRLYIGPKVWIGSYCDITVRNGICRIGDETFLGRGVTIVAVESVSIGCSSLIAEYVTIRDQNHRIDDIEMIKDAGVVSRPVQIGAGVWIGAKATVLKGSEIGDGAVVGANAVVTSLLLPRSVNVGAPAKCIRMRAG